MQGSTSNPKSAKSFLIAFIIILSLSGVGGFFYFKDHAPPAKTEVSLSHLRVVSIPVQAQVYIDGLYKGSSPLGIDLPAGKHEVRITAPSYNDWEAQVTLKEGKEIPLNIRLTPMEEPGT